MIVNKPRCKEYNEIVDGLEYTVNERAKELEIKYEK